MSINLENSAGATGKNWKRSVFVSIPKNCNAKEWSNYHTIVLISHANKVMFKVLQARLLHYVNQELPHVPAGFQRGKGNRDQIANICCIIEKEGSSRKISTSATLTTWKSLTVWITTNWKILKEMAVPRPPYLFPEKPVCGPRSN